MNNLLTSLETHFAELSPFKIVMLGIGVILWLYCVIAGICYLLLNRGGNYVNFSEILIDTAIDFFYAVREVIVIGGTAFVVGIILAKVGLFK